MTSSSSIALTSSPVPSRNASVSLLGDYIEKRLMNSAHNGDSKARIIARRVLQTGGLAIIAIGRIGVTMLCMKGAANVLGRDIDDPISQGLGITSGISNIVIFGVLSAYGTLNLIKELTRTLTPEEALLLTNKVPTCTRRAIIVSSLAIGLLAQVPTAYATYASSFFAPVLNYVGQQLDFGRASFSTFNTLMGVAEMQRTLHLPIEIALLRSRDKFLAEIDLRRKALSFNTDERDVFLHSINGLSNPDPSNIQDSLRDEHKTPFILESGPIAGSNYKDYISAILDFTPSPSSASVPLSQQKQNILKVFTLLMTAAILAEIFELTRDGVSSFDSTAFAYTAASIVALANTHIWLSLIQQSTHFTIDFFRNAITTPITHEFMPRTYKAITYIGTACSFMTFVPEMYFANLYFPRWAAYPIGILASLGTIFGGIGAVHSLRDLLIRTVTKRSGRPPLLQVDEQLEKLSALLAKISPQQYGVFLLSLPDNLQASLESPCKVELRGYLMGRDALT